MKSRSRARLMLAYCLLGCGVLILGGCRRPEPGAVVAPLQEPPVDAARVSAADAAIWRHQRSIAADLNGDGTPERLVLVADVQLSDSGQPLWEDGHRWAVFVADTPQVTLLYAAFVPNGSVEAAVLTGDGEGRRHVLVHERTPGQTRSMVIAYERPGTARSISEANYQIENWVPTLVRPE